MAVSDRDRKGSSGGPKGGPSGAGREKGVGGGNRGPAREQRTGDLSGALPSKSVPAKVMRPSDAYNAMYAEEAGMGNMMVDPTTGRLGVQTPSMDLGAGLAMAAGLMNPMLGAGLSAANTVMDSPLTVGGDILTGNDLSAAIAGRTARGMRGSEGANRERPSALPPGRAANQTAPGLSRPAALGVPGSLANVLSSAMTPLQMRSSIATHGTQGTGGRDREAYDYWRNILERQLINDQGAVTPWNQWGGLLPVESQWLQQAFGFGLPQTTDTRTLLSSLASF